MGTWATIGIHPPVVEDPTTAAARALSLRSAMQGQQLQGLQMQNEQLDLQQKRQDMQDQQVMRQEWANAGGDMDKFMQGIAGKISVKNALGVSQMYLDQKAKKAVTAKDTAEADKNTQETNEKRLGALYDTTSALMGMPSTDERAQAWPAARKKLITAGHLDPADAPEDYPGDGWIALHHSIFQTKAQEIAAAAEKRAADLQGPALLKAQTDAENAAMDTASRTIDTVQDQPAYEQWLGGFAKQAPRLAAQLPGKFDPATTPALIKRMAVPTKDQPNFDIEANKAAMIKNAKPEEFLNLVDQIAPPTVKENVPLNQRTKAQVQAALNRGDIEGAKAVLTAASSEVRQLEVATDPRVAANKVQVSVATQNALADANATEDDYKRAGQQYMMTGVMPPLGRGSAERARIMHYSNEAAREAGLSPADVVKLQAAYAGDKKSLESFQRQRDQIVSFEQTAQKNLDQFINLASKIPDTGVPWLNMPIRVLDQKLVGAENMAAINAARQVANNEIAKVTSGGGLSGVLSDSARHEVEAFNPQNATLGQTLAVAKVLKQDMANRHASMDATLGEIKNRIGGGSASQQQTEAPKATKRYNPQTGRVEVISQ